VDEDLIAHVDFARLLAREVAHIRSLPSFIEDSRKQKELKPFTELLSIADEVAISIRMARAPRSHANHISVRSRTADSCVSLVMPAATIEQAACYDEQEC
jgi:hypothetical protein